MKFSDFLVESSDDKVIALFKELEAKDPLAKKKRTQDKNYLKYFYDKNKDEITAIAKKFRLDDDHLGAVLMDFLES
jgi:hypothetical protein